MNVTLWLIKAFFNIMQMFRSIRSLEALEVNNG